MHMYMHHYTVDHPQYTWIHCIHAGTPRGYYMCTITQWTVHGIHGCIVSMRVHQGATTWYTVDCPRYTWIHCIHAGTPRGYYVCTITQWTVHGIHGYIVSMRVHQGATTCGLSTVYMDTLYPCGHTKGPLHGTQWTVHGTWIHCIHAGTPRGYYMVHSGLSMVYMDTLYPCGHTKGLLCMHHYTVDRPWYAWIHCIHAGTPRGYYMCTITQWTVHGIHGYIVSMRVHQGATTWYTVDCPRYTWIHCIHAGTPRGYYVCTITQWTVHGIHGYIVSMRVHQGATTCGLSTVYMDTLYPCGHTKGLLHGTQWTVHGTWIHCIHAGTPRGYYMVHSGLSTVYMDTLYPCGHTKGLLHGTQWTVHGIHGYIVSMRAHQGATTWYTVDCPWYTWIHCIHAGTPRGYYVCTITQWTVHGMHGYIVSMRAHQGAITCVLLHSGPSMVYMDTLYPCGHTKGLLCMYHYTVDCPWYTWIHCIHAGAPRGHYMWTVHGIHGYIVSMRAHQGAIMYAPLHSGPSMVYMDTLYPCGHTKGLLHVYHYTVDRPWYTWIHCIHAGTPRGYYAIMCVSLHSGPSMVYMDTLYPCGHTKGLLCVYHYTVDRPCMVYMDTLYPCGGYNNHMPKAGLYTTGYSDTMDIECTD